MAKQSLEAERLNLLAKIQHAERQTYLEKKNEALQELEREYNSLIDELGRLTPKRCFDPLRKLPPELCHIIIYEVVIDRASQPFHEDFYDSSKALVLTLVSTLWRDFILGMRLLWTDILLDSLFPDCSTRTALSLFLSQDAPINLHFDFPLEDFHLISAVIMPHRDRIQSISMRFRPERPRPKQKLADIYRNVLEQLLPLPNLFHFFILPGSVGEDIIYWLLENCKSLETMWGVRLKEDMIQLGSTHQLQGATTSMDIERLLYFQAELRNLTKISFVNPNPIDGGPVPLTYPLKTSFPPIRWKEVHYHQSYLLSSAHFRWFTDVVTLSLTSRAVSVREIFTNIHHLSKLEFLKFTSEASDYIQDVLPEDVEITPNPHVKSLRLHLTVRSSGALTPHKRASRIQRCVIRALPAIEDLSISMSGVPVLPELYNGKGLLHLSKLNFEDGVSFPGSDAIVFASSIYTIGFIFPPPLSRFASPSADRLDLNIPFSSMARRKSMDLLVEKWPCLLSLSVRGVTLTGQDFSFKHLRKLELKGPTPRWWIEAANASEDITRFCLQLATRPTDLPLLESLSLHVLPHWDILLLMLKRRNIIWADIIKPLKTLDLLACYPNELTVSIASLLQGKFSHFHSLRDVSLHGIAELLHDTSM
jgi:hypothetical protein